MPTWGTAPPQKYDHPYRGPVIVHVLSTAEVRRICRSDACARLNGKACEMVLPKGDPNLWFIRRHEEAHCSGWPGDHRGGRMVRLK